MRITSGATSEYLYFVAFSTADHITRVSDLTSFTVEASVAGSSGATFATSVSIVNSTRMPGVYKLLLADSTIMTISTGVDSREVCLHITSSMDPVTRTFELYRPKLTVGETLSVVSSVADVTVLSISTLAANTIADSVLNRNMATGTDSGSPSVRTVRQALRFLRNRWVVSGGTLTVYKEDDTTSSWTSTVTSSATADPIIESNPAD
jgi:hypothetical protein